MVIKILLQIMVLPFLNLEMDEMEFVLVLDFILGKNLPSLKSNMLRLF